MKRLMFALAVLLSFALPVQEVRAEENAEGFARKVIESLLVDKPEVTFATAEKLFTLDNEEVLTRDQLKAAWPEFGKMALKKKVDAKEFFEQVKLKMISPLKNKRLMSDKRVLRSYVYQDGDLYCDIGQMKKGAENIIAYKKAFQFLIRKIDGKWTLIGIGG